MPDGILRYPTIAEPATPPAGKVFTYVDIADDHLKQKDDTGTVLDLTLGGVDASETVKGIAELATQAETDTGTDDTRIVTPLKLKTSPVVPHTHTHASTTGQTADDHHSESHTIVSHSDTTATGAELDTLTDGSNADSLHVHSPSGVFYDVVGYQFERVSEKGLAYSPVGDSTYRGDVNVVTKIKAFVATDAGAGETFSVRVIDLGTSLVISEVTGLSNTGKVLVDLGSVSNIGVIETSYEIQVKHDNGDGKDKVMVEYWRVDY